MNTRMSKTMILLPSLWIELERDRVATNDSLTMYHMDRRFGDHSVENFRKKMGSGSPHIDSLSVEDIRKRRSRKLSNTYIIPLLTFVSCPTSLPP